MANTGGYMTLPDQNSSGESPPARPMPSHFNKNGKPPVNAHKAYTEINDSFDDDY